MSENRRGIFLTHTVHTQYWEIYNNHKDKQTDGRTCNWRTSWREAAGPLMR